MTDDMVHFAAQNTQPGAANADALSLALRLEAAPEGCRALDLRVAEAVGFPVVETPRGLRRMLVGKRREIVPLWTRSIDSAHGLVACAAVGWKVAQLGQSRDPEDFGNYVGGWEALLHLSCDGSHYYRSGKAATPALALAAAALRAAEANSGPSGPAGYEADAVGGVHNQ